MNFKNHSEINILTILFIGIIFLVLYNYKSSYKELFYACEDDPTQKHLCDEIARNNTVACFDRELTPLLSQVCRGTCDNYCTETHQPMTPKPMTPKPVLVPPLSQGSHTNPTVTKPEFPQTFPIQGGYSSSRSMDGNMGGFTGRHPTNMPQQSAFQRGHTTHVGMGGQTATTQQPSFVPPVHNEESYNARQSQEFQDSIAQGHTYTWTPMGT